MIAPNNSGIGPEGALGVSGDTLMINFGKHKGRSFLCFAVTTSDNLRIGPEDALRAGGGS